jgi:hypothetical protein
VDGDKGGYETLAALEREYGQLPHTQRVRTAHGEHVYLKYPGIHLKNTAGKLGAGLDIRCCGGYVVASGAVHRSGHLYHWVAGHGPGQAPIGDVPEWLIASLTQHSVPRQSMTPEGSGSPDRDAARYARGALRSELAQLAESVDGERNDRLNRAAFQLGQFVPRHLDRRDV